MARFYTEISKEKFLKEVEKLFDGENYPYGNFPDDLPSIVQKDLAKVNFDWENCTSWKDCTSASGFSDYPVGYRKLKEDFHIFFVNAGGDWEYPICFIFYWNNGLRAYIPKEGNVWNKKEKCAYGSEEDGPDDNLNWESLDEQIHEGKMMDEILNHITKK